MSVIELFILIVLGLFVVLYRQYSGRDVTKFVKDQSGNITNKYAPYSYAAVKDKVKQMGQNYSFKDYVAQCSILGIFAAVVSFLYFYNVIISAIYVGLVIAIVPYLAYLRTKRIYSEFVFEQVQVYTTNTIMEFATTKSFVKSLEGVISSGVLEEPILSDVKYMIDLSYKNGNIEESIAFMDSKYPYFIIKNMHQLFLQITKEGSRDSGESLENMQNDVDMLVESVYRDRTDRKSFHGKFLKFGFALYFLCLLVQALVGNETYVKMLDKFYVQILLHFVLIINTWFILKGEKYYNENVGVE